MIVRMVGCDCRTEAKSENAGREGGAGVTTRLRGLHGAQRHNGRQRRGTCCFRHNLHDYLQIILP
jgi:hypothetical protein